MNRRVLLAGVLGAVAMFLWLMIAHMVLPLGEAGIRQIDNDQALLSTLQATLHTQGLYMFPKMDPAASMEENERKLATGPSGLLIYFPKREFSFGRLLVVEFLIDLLQSLAAAYLLSLTRIGSYAGRVGFFAVTGLMAVTATSLPYWNWYGYPAAYTLPYMFTGWVGYLAAGLVAAKMLVLKAPEPTR
jgi:hypothetical protein